MIAWLLDHAIDIIAVYFLGVIACYTHAAWHQLKTLTGIVDQLLDRTPELPPRDIQYWNEGAER